MGTKIWYTVFDPQTQERVFRGTSAEVSEFLKGKDDKFVLKLMGRTIVNPQVLENTSMDTPRESQGFFKRVFRK
jgi:hypothetical protein